MGMKAAMSRPPTEAPGKARWWRALRAEAQVAASVVLPEPGMPEMAMRRRREEGTVWNFSWVG
jgi:hypothetical protein